MFTTYTIIKGVGQSNVVTMATTLTSISKKNQACLKTVGLIRGSATIHCSVSSSWNTYHNRMCVVGREGGRGEGEEGSCDVYHQYSIRGLSYTLCTCVCMCPFIYIVMRISPSSLQQIGTFSVVVRVLAPPPLELKKIHTHTHTKTHQTVNLLKQNFPMSTSWHQRACYICQDSTHH